MILKNRGTKLELKKTHDHSAVSRPKLAVIFIHGIAADSSSFTRAIDYLEGTRSLRDIRFITFDLLGSGSSHKSDDLNYDYHDQLSALHNSIAKLRLKVPVILVGHSMGTLIAVRYANTYKKSIHKLILISPPVYTEKELQNTAFQAGMKIFRDAVSAKNRKVLEEKSFNNSMDKIVADKNNYKSFVDLKICVVLIYGNKDKFIASYNIPKLLKDNPRYLTAIKTEGLHGVSRDKYTKMVGVLEEALNDLA